MIHAVTDQKSKDCIFWRQFNEPLSLIIGCCMLHHHVALLCTHAWLLTGGLAQSAKEGLFVTPRHMGECDYTHVGGGQ